LITYIEIDDSIQFIPRFHSDEIQSRLKWEACNNGIGSSRVFKQAEGFKKIQILGSKQDPELFKFEMFLKQCDDVYN
jgi:hypothetical protein